MAILSFQYKLYPSEEQVEILEQTLEVCRYLYNNALGQRIDAWKHEQCSITYNHQQNQLPHFKRYILKQEERASINITTIYSQIAQDVLKRLQKAYDNFFRRVEAKQKGKKIKAGFPRFKGIGRYRSFTYPDFNSGVKLTGNLLHLSKIGDILIRLHRPLEGTPKTCTISRKADGWYASICCEVAVLPLAPTGKEVGIDVGIENFATLSGDHPVIPNPRYLQKAQAHLRRCQRRLERRSRYNGQQGKLRKLLVGQSKRREKARILLAKAHQKVANARKDFLHKVSHDLIEAFDVIYVEDFNIQNMLKNHHLAKHIADAGWGLFFVFLIYKAERAAKTVVKVNPRNTSQNCSRCGNYVPKNLSVRTHSCPYCGLVVHRDKNSAECIEQVGRDAAFSRQRNPAVSGEKPSEIRICVD